MWDRTYSLVPSTQQVLTNCLTPLQGTCRQWKRRIRILDRKSEHGLAMLTRGDSFPALGLSFPRAALVKSPKAFLLRTFHDLRPFPAQQALIFQLGLASPQEL